jgi:hypothetical protein
MEPRLVMCFCTGGALQGIAHVRELKGLRRVDTAVGRFSIRGEYGSSQGDAGSPVSPVRPKAIVPLDD